MPAETQPHEPQQGPGRDREASMSCWNVCCSTSISTGASVTRPCPTRSGETYHALLEVPAASVTLPDTA